MYTPKELLYSVQTPTSLEEIYQFEGHSFRCQIILRDPKGVIPNLHYNQVEVWSKGREQWQLMLSESIESNEFLARYNSLSKDEQDEWYKSGKLHEQMREEIGRLCRVALSIVFGKILN